LDCDESAQTLRNETLFSHEEDEEEGIMILLNE